MIKKVRWKSLLFDTLIFIAGSILYALGIYTFALHADFAPGGISGLALIIHSFTGLPLGVLSLLLNIPLIIVCSKIIGFRFIVKSLYVMIINAVFLDIIFPYIPVYEGNPFLASIFTGVFVGAGLALIYMRGASTGGSDFVVMTVKKMKPHFSIGKISLAFDALIILLGGFVFGNIDAVLYGMVSSFATSITLDNVLYGAGTSKLAIIITNHGSKIAEAIGVEVERGSTLIHAIGTYTGEKRDILLCACSKSEIYKVRTTARAVDPESMVMITEASEVFGEGFKPFSLPGSEDK